MSGVIVMYLGARTTRSRFSHLPEVLSHAKRKNPLRINAEIQPNLLRFMIGLNKARFALEIREEQSILLQAVDSCEQIVRHGTCLPFEVGIIERPIAEHFEEGMMIRVMTDIRQIVVFPTDSNAFLIVDDALFRCTLVVLSEEDTFELVHATVDEIGTRVLGRNHR